MSSTLLKKEDKIVVEQEREEAHALPIEWYFPEHIASRYATNLVVQNTEHEFTISFFEVHPPLLLGSPEERELQLQQTKSIRAECVARVIIAAERMPEFVRVIQGQIEVYKANQERLRTPPKQSE
jgi:Protein of unknown function (DUF3467)